MARAPDAPNVVGGQLDPYVSQSLQQGGQQSSNRLIAAMQEQGATQRAGMQTASAEKQQQMAGQQSMQKQAADLAMQDRQMASDEVGKREDRKHLEMMQTQNQQFLATQDKLKLEHDDAVLKHDDARADKIIQMMRDEEDLKRMMDTRTANENNKLLYSFITQFGKKQAGEEQYITQAAADAEETEQTKTMHERSVEEVRTLSQRDALFALDTPTIISFQKTQIGPMIPPVVKEVIEPSGYGKAGGILRVLQAQIQSQGSKVEIGDLLGGNTGAIRDKVVAGKLGHVDIRSAISSIDGVSKAIDEKIVGASESDKKKWGSKKDDLFLMRKSLLRLMDDKTKIVGRTNETVGTVAHTALDRIVGIGRGSEVLKYKASMKASGYEDGAKALAETYRKSQTPGQAFAYPPGANAYMKSRIDAINALGGSSISVQPSAGVGPTLDQLDVRGIEGL